MLEIVPTSEGQLLYADALGHYWRVFPFITNSISFDTVSSKELAFEAACTFGRFFRYLIDMDASQLTVTISDFHNTTRRIRELKEANQLDPLGRVCKCNFLTESLLDLKSLTEKREALDLPLRITHNDTKFNNVLFDKDSLAGTCVIDLDTLMPGTILSDFGDMVRTFTSPVSEEEPDLNLVHIRLEYFKALTGGFLEELGPYLEASEKENLLFGAKLIIYEQCIRFLTDYLRGDVYYPIRYPDQNLDRAKNQWALLQSFFAQEAEMQQIVEALV